MYTSAFELSSVKKSGRMTTQRSIALALIACVIGIFVGHFLPRGASKTEANGTTTSTPPVQVPTNHDCKVERAELSSIKAQLAICKAYLARVPEAAPSATAYDADAEPLKPGSDPRNITFANEVEERRRLLDIYPEAVIVHQSDGKIRVYKPEEWPSDGAGQIVARKFSDGHIGWYAGPDAGPRSDPAAFQPHGPVFVHQPDGTITVNGVEADPAVQTMFGGKVRDAGPTL